MTVGRASTLILGAMAVVLGLLLLQQDFRYELEIGCGPGVEDDACQEESEAVKCRAPLGGELRKDSNTIADADRGLERCPQGRAWRWAVLGGMTGIGAAAAVGAVAISVIQTVRHSGRPPDPYPPLQWGE